MQLRPYTKADLDVLFALDQVCFPPKIAYSRGELFYFLSHPRSFATVAEEAGQVAGFSIAQSIMAGGRRVGHVITIDVPPLMRRRGVASLLMREIEQRLLAQNAVRLTLEMAVDNAGAQAFYMREGFEVTGRMPGYYAGKIDALVMAKTLVGNLDAP